jgi:hypothetical protein
MASQAAVEFSNAALPDLGWLIRFPGESGCPNSKQIASRSRTTFELRAAGHVPPSKQRHIAALQVLRGGVF